MLKASFGTGGFVWLNAGAAPPSGDRQGLLATIAWQLDKPAYALEGFVMYAGAIIDWLLRILDLGSDPECRRAIGPGGREQPAASPSFPPFKAWVRPGGMRKPAPPSSVFPRAPSARKSAAPDLEAICFQTRAVLEAMARVSGKAATLVSVDGGMTRSDEIMAMQAAVLKTPLRRAATVHVAALGAALMAGIGAGLWKGTEEITSTHGRRQPGRRYKLCRGALGRPLRALARCRRPDAAMEDRMDAPNARPDCDLLVIGGGINGAAIACDAAGRGAAVILAEQRDFAEGTSSRSSKLIHGGLRYLETYDFRMVREALIEREILMAKAAHLVRPLRLVLPHVTGQRPLWMIRLGLFLYDHIAPRRHLAASETLDLAQSSGRQGAEGRVPARLRLLRLPRRRCAAGDRQSAGRATSWGDDPGAACFRFRRARRRAAGGAG